MRIDLHAWIGDYPFRRLEACAADDLLRGMDALGIDRAWVGALPAAFRRDPAADNAWLFRALEPHRERLAPVPAVHPGLPHWQEDLKQVVGRGAPAVRAYPPQWALDPAGDLMQALAASLAELALPLLLTVRFEDVRQRHPLDVAPELDGAAVRALVRSAPGLRVVIAAAGRTLLEEVHWGSTREEAGRIWWELSHLWGPPEDELAHLARSIGVDRLVLGTHAPLRIPEAALAKLELLDLAPAERAAIEGATARQFLGA